MKLKLRLKEPTKFIYLIFSIFLLPRLINLGSDVWNVDSHRWMTRSDKFINHLETFNFDKTFQSYHPGTVLMWLTGTAKALFYFLFEQIFHYPVKIADGAVYPEKFFFTSFIALLPIIITICALLTLALININKVINNKTLIIIFAIVLSFEPFYLGVTKFLHLTGLESAFTFASFSFIFRYFQNDDKKILKIFSRNLLLAGVLIGFASATKISGLIFLPFGGLIILTKTIIEIYKNKPNAKNLLIQMVIEGLTLCAIPFFVMYVITPSMWVHPIKRLDQIFNQGIENTAFEDGPHRTILKIKSLYYYEILFVKTLGLSILGIITSFFFIRKEQNSKIKSIFIMTITYTIFYFMVMSFPSKQMTRYLAVIYPFILFASAYSIYFIYSKLQNTKRTIFIAGISIYYFLILFITYPAPSTFISEFLGGYKGYSNLSAIYNDGEHYMQVGQYLNKLGQKDAYDYALVVPSGNKDVSVQPGFLGTVFVNSVKGDKKFKNIFIAVEYYDYEDIPYDCEYIRGFGHRWPDNFDYLYLYKCPGDYKTIKNSIDFKKYKY